MADFLTLNLIIEPAIILSLFYLAYIIFLGNVKLFHARRAYLLSAILISFILPHLSIEPPVTMPTYHNFTFGVTIYENSYQQVKPENPEKFQIVTKWLIQRDNGVNYTRLIK